jgi:hypothetical protein
VRWVDSCGAPGWMAEKVDVAQIESIGWLVSEDKRQVVIALSRGMSPGVRPFGDVMAVPKVSITGMRDLK